MSSRQIHSNYCMWCLKVYGVPSISFFAPRNIFFKAPLSSLFRQMKWNAVKIVLLKARIRGRSVMSQLDWDFFFPPPPLRSHWIRPQQECKPMLDIYITINIMILNRRPMPVCFYSKCVINDRQLFHMFIYIILYLGEHVWAHWGCDWGHFSFFA